MRNNVSKIVQFSVDAFEFFDKMRLSFLEKLPLGNLCIQSFVDFNKLCCTLRYPSLQFVMSASQLLNSPLSFGYIPESNDCSNDFIIFSNWSACHFYREACAVHPPK